MALSSVEGTTETKTPAPSNNTYSTKEVDVSQTADERLVDGGPVKDSFHLENVLDMRRYGDVIAQVRQYVEGNPIEVTYYHLVVPETKRTEDTETDSTSTSNTYVRINDFEIRLTDGLEYSHLTEDNVSQMVGSATVYPGLQPHVGDFLLYTTDPDTGAVGQFKITEVQRLSVRAQTCHRIDLQLVGFVSQSDIDSYEEQVQEVLYFDLRAYLGETSTLLKTDQRQLLEDAETAERVLKRHYCDRFFDTSQYHTFMRPDGVYDPYVAEFLLSIFDHSELPEYPQMHISTPEGGWRSYWTGLMDRDYIPDDQVLTYYIYRTRTVEARQYRITSLVNNDYVVLCNQDDYDTTYPYISEGLTSLDSDTQSDFDKLVRLYYEQRLIDPSMLLTQCQNFHTMADMDQFYRIPVYMFLLTLLKQTIITGADRIKYGSAVEYLPTEYEFTADDLSGNHLIITMDNKALGVIMPDGTQKRLDSGEVVYDSGNIHVDLRRLIEEAYDAWQWPSDPAVYTASWTSGSDTITPDSVSGIEIDMAVESEGGQIPYGTRVKDVTDGGDVVLTQNTADTGDVTDESVTIDFPVFNNTWTLVLTGNVKES